MIYNSQKIEIVTDSSIRKITIPKLQISEQL